MVINKEKYTMTDAKGIILDNVEGIRNLLKQTYWAKDRSLKEIERSVQNSLCYAVFDDTTNRIIAFSRIVTDYVSVFYLCDVIVDEKYRGQGIAKMMLDWIMKDEIKLQGLKGVLFTKDAHGLYSKYGFENSNRCMCKFTANE